MRLPPIQSISRQDWASSALLETIGDRQGQSDRVIQPGYRHQAGVAVCRHLARTGIVTSCSPLPQLRVDGPNEFEEFSTIDPKVFGGKLDISVDAQLFRRLEGRKHRASRPANRVFPLIHRHLPAGQNPPDGFEDGFVPIHVLPVWLPDDEPDQ